MFYANLLLLSIAIHLSVAIECEEIDLQTESTECDDEGFRWIFKVPRKKDYCSITNESLPISTKNCDVSCLRGQFYNIATNECTNCSPGSFSGGEAIIITEWNRIEEEFQIDTSYPRGYETKCSESNWKVQDDSAVGRAQPNCIVTLSKMVHIMKPGKISFTYNIEDAHTMAIFTIRNSRCSQVPKSTVALQPTGRNVFYEVQLHVPKGKHVFQWVLYTEDNILRAFYKLPDSRMSLKTVQIVGAPPAFNCTPCPGGTYSSKSGSEYCAKCPANTYSAMGAVNCTKCSDTEYSNAGSAVCTKMEPCKESDYFETWSPCDANHQTSKQYQWVEPRICNSANFALPVTTLSIPCKPCPVGTMLLNNTHCTQCPSSSVSNNSQCLRCPKDRVPVYGVRYNTWSRWPPNLYTRCIQSSGNKCEPWTLNMNSVWAGAGSSLETTSILELKIANGFLATKSDSEGSQSAPLTDTYLNFDFEMLCNGFCSLQLKQTEDFTNYKTLMTWTGNQTRRNHSVEIINTAPTNFIWEFYQIHHSPQISIGRLPNLVKIFSIDVTNTIGMGIIGCRSCPLGVDNGACVLCPRGMFISHNSINESTHIKATCVPCPSKTIVTGNPFALRTIDEACQPCPAGMTDIDRTRCVLDTEVHLPNNMVYNVTNLVSKEQSVKSSKLFTPNGVPYYYEFRLTLAPSNTVTCVGNSTESENSVVRAIICRTTVINHQPEQETMSYSQPISLADYLVQAIPSNSSQEFWHEINVNLTRAGWTEDVAGTDLHYFFKTNGPSPGCENGRTTILTLRCGLNLIFDQLFADAYTQNPHKGLLNLPPKCPSGTCDGCVYHMLWVSTHACPICSAQDIGRFFGECVRGKQSVKLYPIRGCRLPLNMTSTERLSCPLLSTAQTIAISLTIVILIILIAIIFICNQKNKKLKYKYMKLIEASKSHPTSCALDESEETKQHPEIPVDASFSHTRFDGGIVLSPTNLVRAAISKFSSGRQAFVDNPPVIFRKPLDEDSIVLPEHEMTQPQNY